MSVAHDMRERQSGSKLVAIWRALAFPNRSTMEGDLRILTLLIAFIVLFLAVLMKMTLVATSEPSEPKSGFVPGSLVSQRANILDRNGVILATNLPTYAAYAHPQEIQLSGRVDRAARELATVFPELDEARLRGDLSGRRKFLWIKRRLAPEEWQSVHDIGEPGLYFGPREARVYPNGRQAAHVIGGVQFGGEGVHAAEINGVAGVEREFESFLRDPANGGQSLQLSLDLGVQAVTREVLANGVKLTQAVGGSAVVMDALDGEILAMVSLPDFDPNDRQAHEGKNAKAASPLFNRAVQGVYELGSTFKIFAAAQAIELGLVNPETVVSTLPVKVGKHLIEDHYNKRARLTVNDIIAKSSNTGSVRLAQLAGSERQKEFMRQLGLLDSSPVEMPEARLGKPQWPRRWTHVSNATIAYGHGISVTPVHLAAAYASLVNGGERVTPTILHRNRLPEIRERLIAPETSEAVRSMLRLVVTHGTAASAGIKGYAVGGKTGTADKPSASGGYAEDKVLAVFAAVLPAADPRYVIVITLDEPEVDDGEELRRTASWTSVPVTTELIMRLAPMLGLRPDPPAETDG